jgi:hypothetical protein
MRHYDYEWDLYPNYLKLDDELNTDALGWQDGDIFKFVTTEQGIKMLKKVDRLVGFLEEGTRNGKV